MRRHKACVMSGEGGIGKSYFLKCLEETLEKEGTKHLCVYGKFEKEINRIDFNQIANLAQRETFVIIIDAINEMHSNAQKELIEKLKEIKPIKGVRIIVSYRTLSLDEGIKQQLEAICETQYSFPGISFESALRILEVLPVENLYLYEDILYTQNALFLKMLYSVLHSESLKGEIGRGRLKSITSITYIYEQYIKNSIDVETWRLTKRIADWMFHNNCRRIGIDIVHGLTQDAEAKLAQLREYGFVSYYEYEGRGEVFFTIDSITEYLIGRSAFEYIQREDRNNRIGLIADIVKKMPWLSEAIVLVVFDLLSPDYVAIYTTLVKADLLDLAGYSVLRKVVFQPENISEFQKVFIPKRKGELLFSFGGYGGKPFNCENYLNDYFIENKKETKKELTSLLSDPYHSHEIRGRLKNILYMIYLQDVDQHMLAEASSFAMWCCASPNEGIRCIAMKLLYETMRLSEGLQKRAVECFADIEDHYIRESIVCALSFAATDGTKPIVDAFFEQLIDDPCFVSEKSLKYIEEYCGVQEAYIHWNRKDYYADGSRENYPKKWMKCSGA